MSNLNESEYSLLLFIIKFNNSKKTLGGYFFAPLCI